MNTAKPNKVHMSAERRAEFKKLYPTPELRAEARARIKAGRPARLAAKKPRVTTNTTMGGTVTTNNTTTSLSGDQAKALREKILAAAKANGATKPAPGAHADPFKAVHDLIDQLTHSKPRPPGQQAARASSLKAKNEQRAALVARLTQPTKRMK